jgi:probable HAF family extracellular repeat protein
MAAALNPRATEWSGGSFSLLGGLPGATASYASAINNSGQIVGYSTVGIGYAHATEWSGRTWTA